MNSFSTQNHELIAFDATFDCSDFNSCVNRAILLIKNREAQMIEDGYEWPINTESCRYSIEQAIINRSSDQTMMQAAISYVEIVEYRAENFNGLLV